MDTTDENPSVSATFISIHNLSPEARILYSSDSIIDVLGYTPDEVVDRSVWDFFPPEELPYAQHIHQKGIAMDKAAMLSYCRVRNKDGNWVGCECCFTITYDCMIVCTSIYQNGLPSQKRALEAPIIRRLFSNSPRDPRYHMLSHISQKFRQPSKADIHEPRAALFLNRFTRTLTIMYATNGLEDVVGIPAEVMRGKSFYYCIAQNCLQDAVKCLENAKGNDSIAYLRFWFRDPRIDDIQSTNDPVDESDEEMTTDTSVDQEMGGGVHLGDGSREDNTSGSDDSSKSNAIHSESSMDIDQGPPDPQSRTSSGDSTDPPDTHEAIFGTALQRESSSSTVPSTPGTPGHRPLTPSEPIELEAVVSCASDGLVVCLRRARPMLPQPSYRPSRTAYENGLFAAPWAEEPMVPAMDERASYGQHSGFAPSLGPRLAQKHTMVHGPSNNDFMTAIRDQAIFAWALTGINGSLQRYGKGTPLGESIPPSLPVWQSDHMAHEPVKDARTDSASSGIDGSMKSEKYSPTSTAFGNDHRKLFGDPGIFGNRATTNGSKAAPG